MSAETEFSVPLEFEDGEASFNVTLDDVVHYAYLRIDEYDGNMNYEKFAIQVKKLIDDERSKAFKSGMAYASNIIDNEREKVVLEW